MNQEALSIAVKAVQIYAELLSETVVFRTLFRRLRPVDECAQPSKTVLVDLAPVRWRQANRPLFKPLLWRCWWATHFLLFHAAQYSLFLESLKESQKQLAFFAFLYHNKSSITH